MKQYLTKLMFNIHIDDGNDASQFDEQIRIVQSESLEDAFHKARRIGKTEEETFMNSHNRPVRWQFIDVSDVYSLEELKDGEQLYSNTHKIKDTSSFIRYIRQRSMEIQAKNLTFA
jgi:Domain of unknown function (DUF4288)